MLGKQVNATAYIKPELKAEDLAPACQDGPTDGWLLMDCLFVYLFASFKITLVIMASRERSPDVMGLSSTICSTSRSTVKLRSGWHCVIMHVAVLGYEML